MASRSEPLHSENETAIPREPAHYLLAFAIGFHLAGFIPVTAMGLYYVWRLGLSWRDVEHSEDAVESAVELGRGDADASGQAGRSGAP